ncbi:MAG: Fic family protein [Chloroflexi bacterium]|nr:Fic family protein [Chloroflexota bacterium]
MQPLITRAGRFVKQPAGYTAFIPAPLPPDPPIQLDAPLASLLSKADQAVGRLDGAAQTLPNPDLFVAMYVRREAVLSSQIEGTQSTLDDVLEFELDPAGRELPQDVEEVVNYVRAMNYGLNRLNALPLSLRLIREIHAELLRDVRGADRQPGEFRTSQNWIGAANVPLSKASFVPPPPSELISALGGFEHFLNEERELPDLIHCGLAHAQFETIHPFLDGNGRVGRLLITFLLCHREVLHRPLLYLSHYLKGHRAEYYDRLMAVREEGNWEGWLRFFLRGVAETATEATNTARSIVTLREEHRSLVQKQRAGLNGLRLLDVLFERPLVNVKLVMKHLKVAFVTANKLVEQFESLGLVKETSGGQRNRRYRYTPYLDLLTEPEPIREQDVPVQTTAGESPQPQPSPSAGS